jgi:hypothetical protein
MVSFKTNLAEFSEEVGLKKDCIVMMMMMLMMIMMMI